MSQVLINDVVKKYFLRQPRKLRAKIREKFEFLENGIWDSGLQVKKLAGVSSKVIFEARLDKGNRILFSLGKDTFRGTEDLAIYVWGVVVHDDVSRTVRRILPSEVPFLHFQEFKEEIIEQPDLEALPESYLTQETISARVSDDSAAQRWHRVDEPEWDRILRYAKDDFDLFMSLSPEQDAILSSACPLMISGTAGSGKTTMAVYYLLKKGLQQKSKLFLTYNRHLRDFARKLYLGLLNERGDASRWVHPDFHTAKGFCLDIAQKHRSDFPPEKEVTLEIFSEIFYSHRLSNQFDATLVWEEIRSIIKGALPQVNLSVIRKAIRDLQSGPLTNDLVNKLQTQFVNFSKLESTSKIEKATAKYLKCDLPSFARRLPRHLEEDPEPVQRILEQTLNTLKKAHQVSGRKYLSLFEYETLGKKKAPNFQFDRNEIYQIFEWYQRKLEAEGLWDELDLAREVIRIISERDWNPHRYDLVICDEVQDLTDIQHDILFSVVKNPNDLLLAGDTKQIINPSGFRWEELKRHFYERDLPVPELRLLTLNFRSSGSIVELANRLLALKRDFLGVRSEESEEDWKYKGRPAVIVSGIGDAAMLESVKQAGANRTILVRSEEERERLKKILETEIVFTINEAKGLEFATVLLWKFGSDSSSSDVWDVILKKSARRVHQARIKHEINLLYVGITRARRDLIVFDGMQPSSIWRDATMAENTFSTDDRGYIDSTWNVISTPEEWREQGTYFFERRYLKAAMECFKNAGDEKRLAEASAHYHQREGNHRQAARYFEKVEDWGKAAENHERAGDFDKALPLWGKLERNDRIIPCKIEIYKRQGKNKEVADLYESIGSLEQAAEFFERARDYARAATIYGRFPKHMEKAAHYYEKAGQYLPAARLNCKLKRLDKAAQLYFKLSDYRQAEKLWKRLKDNRSLIRLYEKTHQQKKLLEIHEKEKDFKKTVRALRAVGGTHLLVEADEYFRKRKYFQAWARYHVIEDHAGVAKCCHRLRNFGEAARRFESAGDMLAAGNAHTRANHPQKAIECYLHSDEDRNANYRRTKKLLRNANLIWIHDTARKLFGVGELEQAALLYERCFQPVEAGICHAKLGNKEKSMRCWGRYHAVETAEEVARRCIEHEEAQLAGEWIVTHVGFIPSRSEAGLNLAEDQCPNIFAAADRYLDECADKGTMNLWAMKLGYAELNFESGPVIMRYHEQAGDYNACLTYMERKKQEGYQWPEKDLLKWKSELPDYESRGDACGLALRYALLSMRDELNREVENLAITLQNSKLFEESDHYMKAIELYLESGNMYAAQRFFANKGRLEEWAPLLESRGRASYAAMSYESVGDFEAAIRCHQKDGNYLEAGDLYFRLKDYSKALEAYLKMPLPNLKKIARTHERQDEWSEALKIYRELDDWRGCKRCEAKIVKREAKRQAQTLPFPEISATDD